MAEVLYLGVDAGTTAIKAALFDPAGQMVASASRPSQTVSSRKGWSSQDMNVVWQTTLAVIRDVCSQVEASNIGSIGVCGQGDGLWALDENRKPVRNAILWNDQRASKLVDGWIEDGTSDRLSQYSRTSIWAGTSGATYRWLKDNEPETAKRINHVLHCKDWINLNLTGNLTTDFADATIPFLDLESRTYASDAFALLGVEELESKLLQPQAGDALNGTIAGPVARETGLPAGTPVAVGGLDVSAMMFGAGIRNAGDTGIVLGTTAVVAVVVDPHRLENVPAGATITQYDGKKWLRVLAPLCGASALDWYTSIDPANFTGSDAGKIADQHSALAAQSSPGANGVLFLPFLSGERAPFVAAGASAAFLGVTNSSTKADMARAVMEGAAFSLRHCFESTGLSAPRQIVATGGGARNHLWCDMIASIMKTEVVASDASDHGLWGAALLGASAAGLTETSRHDTRSEDSRRHIPDSDLQTVYDRQFVRYLTCVNHAKPLWDAWRETRPVAA